MTASNAYAASNGQSNWVFASNTSVWGSNNASNLLSAYAASNAQSNWVFASNTSVAASNAAFWGSNNGSNLLSLVTASNAYAASNGQSNWVFASNTSVWGSNNASNLLSAYAASNAQSNWVFASNTSVTASNTAFWSSNRLITGPVGYWSLLGNAITTSSNVSVFGDFYSGRYECAFSVTVNVDSGEGYGFGHGLNFLNSTNAIGLQASTLYVRANDDIRYYYRGAHSDTTGDPGVGGTGLFTVKGATGNVAIGSFSNPQDRLHILGDMRVYNGLNTADSGGIIKFGTSNNPTFGEMASIKGVYFSSNTTNFAGGLAFFTRSNNATSNTTTQERMRITHYGSVGIGTTTPAYNLEVTGDINATSNIRQGGALVNTLFAASNAQSNWVFASNTANWASNNSGGGGGCNFNFNGSNTFTGTNSFTSNVVIGGGTFNPADELTVNGSLVVNGFSYLFGGFSAPSVGVGGSITLRTAGYGIGFNLGNENDKLGLQMSNLYIRVATDFSYYYQGTHSDTRGNPGAGGSTLFTIKGPTGNIAIGGFSNPQDRLHILGDMRVYNGLNTADSGGIIKFGTSNNPTFGEMASIKGVYFSSNTTNFAGGLAFFTRSNNATSNTTTQERMRITHTGQVLIGMTSTACNYIFMVSSDSAAKPGTNTWTIASDERIKENIVSANVGICYSNVKNIPLKYYKWRDDIYTEEQVRDRHKLGWIAQDVELVFPKAVDIAPMFGYPDCRSLNNDQIIASMYGAVQHIQNTLEAQADRERQQRRLVTVDLDVTSEKQVVNAAVTGPRCDVVHRGRATLANGQAQIDLDGECGYSPGTFEALFHNVQFFLQNVTGFSRLRGEVTESILTILCENASGIDQISWMVMAERKDSYVLGGADGRTNASGYLYFDK